MAVRIDADPARDHVGDCAVGGAKRHADIDEEDAASEAGGLQEGATRELHRHAP
jgi:hypothetical protein